MDRKDWIRSKRQRAEERMDRLFAPQYDLRWGKQIDQTHRKMLESFLEASNQDGYILDAACGTGKYWPILLEAGQRILGIDHSQRMLDFALEKHPQVPVFRTGLQEIAFSDLFDGIICIDAMENIPPEDWHCVMRNFKEALISRNMLYFTVEIIDAHELATAYELGKALTEPLVFGEVVHDGGYHFYPEPAQVQDWTEAAGFQIEEQLIGDGYLHILAKK